MKWLLLVLIAGCAQVTSLNMRKHEFGLLPTKIIWFQIAGLDEEHLSMLRFYQAAERKSAFEEAMCVGKTWNYNLYELKPSAQASFLAQLTGKKNVKHSCEDAGLRPIWNYLVANGYNTGVLETGAQGAQSILDYRQCGEAGDEFLSNLYLWQRSQPVSGADTFHYADAAPMKPNVVYYDRSCQKQGCLSTITEDFKSIYQGFSRVSAKHILLVRDFTYLRALEARNFPLLKNILADLERSFAEALKLAGKNSDYLVLLSTGDSRFIDVPDQGKGWYEFEKSGATASVKRAKLTNTVLATGSRAENFCGIYDDSQIFERILSGPKQLGLELKFINPFK
jgi:hypothetical protein